MPESARWNEALWCIADGTWIASFTLANTTRLTLASLVLDYPISYIAAQCSDGSQLPPVSLRGSRLSADYVIGANSTRQTVLPADGLSYFDQFDIQ